MSNGGNTNSGETPPARRSQDGDAEKRAADEYDSPWKEVVELFFEQLTALLFPEIHARIDWSYPYESLEQELREVVRGAGAGAWAVDKLIKVRTKDGDPLYVFVHIEIQVTRDDEFAMRMYIYQYRLFDLHPKAVANLAILGDDDASWRPERFEHELMGSKVSFEFPTVKLLDYNDRWAELEALAPTNPGAVVVMAHLKARATRKDKSGRLSWKKELVRRLYELGYKEREIRELFRFIDWVMALPKELERDFRDEVHKIEEERRMRYVTSIERLAMEEAAEQNALKILKRLLTRRFGELPGRVLALLEKSSQADLERWIDRVLDANSLDEVFAT